MTAPPPPSQMERKREFRERPEGFEGREEKRESGKGASEPIFDLRGPFIRPIRVR